MRAAIASGSRILVVSGVGGIGKTALVAGFLSVEGARSTLRVSPYSAKDPDYEFAVFLDTLDRSGDRPRSIVIDGGELLRADLLREGAEDLLRRYPDARVFVTSRIAHDLPDATHIHLGGLGLEEATDILAASAELSREDARLFAQSLGGHPLAIHLLLGLTKSHTAGELRLSLGDAHRDLLGAKFYSSLVDASGLPLETHQEVTSEVRHKVTVVQSNLVADLKKRPEDMHGLSPRQFEEVVAELLRDHGFDIQLTTQSRDGGKDIIASLNSELGQLLILVEAKRYRPDRPVGVELVRNLYGVVCDAQANSGVLVTTSYFTKGAQEFRGRHNYQLQLRDFKDLSRWIQGYGGSRQ